MTSLLRIWKTMPARLSKAAAAASFMVTAMLFIYASHLQNEIQLYSSSLRVTGQGTLFRSYDRLVNSKLEQGAYEGGAEQSGGTSSKLKSILDQYRHLDPEDLNITKPNTKLTLLFNRVPKVGSQTTMTLIQTMSYYNDFSYHSDPQNHKALFKLDETEQSKLVRMINAFKPPTAYIKHVYFINFTQFGETPPIYINMVRDPVERMISWYYYVRAPWYFVERKLASPNNSLPSPQWLRKDFETCFMRNDPECHYEEGKSKSPYVQFAQFFCGHGPDCSKFNTEYVVKRAIENVEKHYAVVGVLEEMNMTLTVLEHYLPRFFAGAKQFYFERIEKYSKINKNIYKVKVSNKVKNMVRKNFTREVEFYEYCKQRLYKQYAALKLPHDHL